MQDRPLQRRARRPWLGRRIGRSVALVALLAGTAAPFAPLTAEPGSPYADLTQRRIKALSEAEIDDLLAGRGMGLALAAELNGYPGPTHVLDLAESLELTPDQAAATAALRAEMSEAAARLGAEILRGESALDALFTSGTAEPEALHQIVAEIARLQGELRFTHLRAHLAMRGLLTPDQIATYARLRGYDAGMPPDHDHGEHMAD